MPALDHYARFLAASVLLVLTPGPNLLYLISRTLCQGRKAGLVSLAGTSTGFLVHIVAAALGLSAVFIAVPLAYQILKWAGACYLLWLAWNAIRPVPGEQMAGVFAPRKLPDASASQLFRNGLLTSTLNPKVALFYLALFPQFVQPERGSVLTQSLVLGATQIVIAVIGDLLFVLSAAAMAQWLAQRPAWGRAQRWILSGAFAGIAARLVLDERH
jgi:threonine/homoserine/homoserine lactone efflux protein